MRREVAASLAAGVPVVPVLVGGAELPAGDELPDELAPLAQRQAFDIDDGSWHRDVGDLVRRLEGEQAVPDRRRRGPFVVGGIVAIAVVAAVVLLRRDDGGGAATNADGASVDADAPYGCSAPDPRNAVDLLDAPSAQATSTASR